MQLPGNPWLFLKVKWFFFCERRHIRRHYSFFTPCLEAFQKAYRFRNPFRICKSFLKSRGAADVHQYGETPLPVLAKIAAACGITGKDRVIELGCGRGIGCFFLHQHLGCSVTGIDWVPEFIAKAQEIHRDLGGDLVFDCDDILKTNLAGATILYLFGTSLEEEVIHPLIQRFKALDSSVKIITISYPLSDYDPAFRAAVQFPALFPWGEADVYLNRRIDSIN